MAVYNTSNEAYDNGEGLAETSLLTLKDGTVVDSDNPLPVVGTISAGTIGVEPYGLRVAKGDIAGTSSVHKFGYNYDIDKDSDPETVWTAGGLYPWGDLNSPITLYIKSDDNDDDGDIEIQGLDANWDLITETVSMNGTSNVTTTNTFRRVFRAKYDGPASGGYATNNQGTITIKDGSGGGATTVAQIEETQNQTLMAVYTVPNGKTAYMTKFNIGVEYTKKGATFTLYMREFGSNFKIKHKAEINEGTHTVDFPVPLKITAKTDIDIVIDEVGDNDTKVSGGFDLYLVDN